MAGLQFTDTVTVLLARFRLIRQGESSPISSAGRAEYRQKEGRAAERAINRKQVLGRLRSEGEDMGTGHSKSQDAHQNRTGERNGGGRLRFARWRIRWFRERNPPYVRKTVRTPP